MSSMIGSRGAAGSNLSPSGATGNIIPKGHRLGQLQQFSPEQMNLFQQMFGQVGPQSYLSRLAGGEEGAFDQLEAPALKQFGELQGQLGSRFSGMGMGARRGSGFQNTANQATSDFAQALQGQRMELQRNALKDLMGISESLLGQRPYEQSFIKKQKPWWQQLLLGVNDAGKEFAGELGKVAGKSWMGG